MNKLIFIFALLVCVSCGISYEEDPVVSDPDYRTLVKILLNTEYGSSGRVFRFDHAPTLSIFGGNTEQKEQVRTPVDRINLALEGSNVRIMIIADNVSTAEIELHLTPISSFRSVASAKEFPYYSGNSGYFWTYWDREYRITKSYVLVANDLFSKSQFDSVVREEILQSMGLPNDQSDIRDSVFYETDWDAGFAPELGEFDLRAVGLLYRHLHPGDYQSAVAKAFLAHWHEPRR